MSDAWKPVYEKIKVQFLADVKKEIGEIDLSGNTFKDALQIIKAGVDIIDVVDSYADDLKGLSPEDQRELFIQGFDDAVVIPGVVGKFVETIDDNAGGMIWDTFVK